jgi:hypothetical protein
MEHFELRDPDLARDFILESLLLSRAEAVTPDTIAFGLRLAMEVTSDGSPLPPLGLVMDIGLIATSLGNERTKLEEIPGFEAGLVRKYEDYVLGKMYADMSFERATDAIARYSDRDHDRAIAYTVNQICKRCGVAGALLSPAVIKSLQTLHPLEVHAMATELIAADGVSMQMQEDYEALITAIQSTGELMGYEDVFELEYGTALADFGQRIALRQVLKAATELERNLPNQKPRSSGRRYSVATNILEEDIYPVGGFSSISNKGTIESLLRSELAYIDDEVRPDLFDIKFARGELLYYSRDENQFLRRRLSFVFALYPELRAARFKDSGMNYQRIILAIAFIQVAVRRLTQWLSDDSLQFQILFVEAPKSDGLDDERELLETLFHEPIESGNVILQEVSESKLAERADDLGRTSLCHTLHVGTAPKISQQRIAIHSELLVDNIQPTLCLEDETVFQSEDSDMDGWREALERTLAFWV